MKKSEIAMIVEAENSAWERLCEARMIALENSGLPRGCGYDVAHNFTDVDTERERAAWGALDSLIGSLGIKAKHSVYSLDCQAKFLEYATNN